MISAFELRQLIHYQQQKAIFSPQLDKETVALMVTESAFTFACFEDFAKLLDIGTDPNEVLAAIKDYFAIRWAIFKETNIAYTRHPFLPVNQLCLKIAEAIAGPDEAICQILMPSITGLNRVSYSLKAETEEDGHFALEHFIINQDYTKLIPVEEIFQMAETSTNYVIPDFQADANLVKYQLGGRDLLNLEQVAGKASEDYIRAIKKQHAKQFNNNSVGFAIRQLATELKKSSVADAGTEDFAEDEVFSAAIVTFYRLWQSLPLETKEKVNSYRVKHYGNSSFNLESYFLTLFVRHKDCPVSEEEAARVKREEIFPCADQISNYLNEFLIQNKELYNIPLSNDPEEQKSAENLPDLKVLLKDAITGLQNRPQATDGNDSQLLGKFSQFMLKFYYEDPDYIKHIASLLAPHVNSHRDLNLLTDESPLFNEVTRFIEPKVGKFHDIANIKLNLFSAKQQTIIFDAHLDEIIKHNWSRNQYTTIMLQLKHNSINQIRFKQRYLQLLADTVNSSKDFLVLCNTSFRSLLDDVFILLQPKYPLLLNNKENTLNFLSILSAYNQKTVIEQTTPFWGEWITPVDYQAVHQVLAINVKNDFNKVIAEQISSKALSFDDLISQHGKWINHTHVQSLLLDNFAPHLKTTADNVLLLSLLKVTNASICWQVINKFSYLIISKELFLACNKLVPKSNLAQCLSSIPFALFVKSLPELQEILALYPEDALKRIIFAKFDATQLNCTQEEFNLLVQPQPKFAPAPYLDFWGKPLFKPQNKKSFDTSFNRDDLIDDLWLYANSETGYHQMPFFFRGPSSNRERAIYLIDKLRQPTLANEEIAYLLNNLKKDLQHRSQTGSKLLSLIENHLEKMEHHDDNSATMSIM